MNEGLDLVLEGETRADEDGGGVGVVKGIRVRVRLRVRRWWWRRGEASPAVLVPLMAAECNGAMDGGERRMKGDERVRDDGGEYLIL